jgi:hypothetical protein
MEADREIFGGDEMADAFEEGRLIQYGAKQFAFPGEGFPPGRWPYAFDDDRRFETHRDA